MKKIAVLLAAYNCEKYIEEQLDSILNQSGVDISIFVSLDKSTDSSYEIIQSYEKKYKNIHILEYQKRYGSAGKNFFRLITEVNIDAYDFVSFSDQDDVWFPSKISHGINVLNNSNADAYSSNVIALWENGKTKIIKKSHPQVEFDYLFQSAGPGCTYIFKKTKFKIFQKYLLNNIKNLHTVWLHDWLIYAFYRGNGYKWIIDQMPLMHYRQHNDNQIGANFSIRSLLGRMKIMLSKNSDDLVINQAMFLRQNDLQPIILIKKKRIGYLKLALMSSKLRRKNIEKLFCSIYFFIKFLRGN